MQFHVGTGHVVNHIGPIVSLDFSRFRQLDKRLIGAVLGQQQQPLEIGNRV